MKVKLIAYTKDPEQVVAVAIRQCYSAVGASDLKKKIDKETRKRLIKQVMVSGHTSTLEHANFTFAVEGISRACSHQLVRHRIASYSQQSQRYVDESKKGFVYIVPPEIKANKKIKRRFEKMMELIEKEYKEMVQAGIKPEDARFILPNAAETKMVITMNARALLNFFKLRCCRRAQWEIRQMAQEMLRLASKIAPIIFSNVGASCKTENICFEGKMSCGLWKTLKGAELKERT